MHSSLTEGHLAAYDGGDILPHPGAALPGPAAGKPAAVLERIDLDYYNKELMAVAAFRYFRLKM